MGIEAASLRKIALFASLSEDTLDQLRQHFTLRHYDPGEYIQLETNSAPGAFFIGEGRVQIFRVSPEGREQIMANLGVGEAFNLVSLFQSGGTNPNSVRALTAVQVYYLPRGKFLQLVEHRPDLAFAILKDFSVKLASMNGLIEQLSLHSIRGRLARFLIEQADQGNAAERWTQDEMAARLGTVRDVIGRTLRSFEVAGMIKRQQGRIILLDRQALESEMDL